MRGYRRISETIRGNQLTWANCSLLNKMRHDQSLDKIRLVHTVFVDILLYPLISADISSYLLISADISSYLLISAHICWYHSSPAAQSMTAFIHWSNLEEVLFKTSSRMIFFNMIRNLGSTCYVGTGDPWATLRIFYHLVSKSHCL